MIFIIVISLFFFIFLLETGESVLYTTFLSGKTNLLDFNILIGS